MKFISTKRNIIAVVAFLIIGYTIYGFTVAYSKDAFTVARGSITQKVSETGRVISEKDFDLSFKTDGTVQGVYTKVGSEVKKGETLVELGKRELEIQLNQARAQKATAMAKLNQLNAGATEEDISIYESVVANAKTDVTNASVTVENSKIALDDAKRNLVDKIQDAFTNSDDAIRNRVDQFFSNPRATNPKIKFTVSEPLLKSEIEWQRMIIETTMVSWESSLSQLTIESNLASYIESTKDNLNQTKALLDKSASAVNSITASSNLSQSSIDAWKLDVATARSNVNASLSGLSSAEEKINNAQSALRLADGNLRVAEGVLRKAKDELISVKADPRGIDLAVFESQVEVTQGAIELLQKKLRDTVLRSPGSGVVTRVSVEAGERVVPGKIVVSLISESRFELEVYISEEVIVKVAEGLPIKFTLDAFPSKSQSAGEVLLIEPAATIIEEEVYYKVKGVIADDIPGMREGMTADVDIILGEKTDVLLVPAKAVKEIDGKKIVLVRNGLFAKSQRTIETGLSGGGFTEVTSGLKEGDTIIIK